MSIDLEGVAVALDAFPHWDAQQRAEVFHAIDVAREHYYGKIETYQWEAWNRIRDFVLAGNDGKRWAVTLDEAAGYESAPTKEEILKALHRGARMIR